MNAIVGTREKTIATIDRRRKTISLSRLVLSRDQGQGVNHSLNVGNFTGWSCHRNYPLWGNGFEWLVPKRILLSLIESKPVEGDKGLAYWCMPAIVCSLLFLILFPFSFLFSVLTYLVMLWFSLRDYYCHDGDPPYCVRQGTFIYCLLWLIFTILAFNHLYLVWVSLPTLTDLSATQPPLLTRVGCFTSHHQTKNVVLFVCSPWHSYPLRCGYSPFLSLMACT